MGYCRDRGAACGWLGHGGLLIGRIWEWAGRDGTGPVTWERSGVKQGSGVCGDRDQIGATC